MFVARQLPGLRSLAYLASVMTLVVGLCAPLPVHAQDDLSAAAAAGTEPAATEAPAADPQAGGAATDSSSPAPPRQNLLAFFYAALGPLYVVVFLAMSFAFVAISVMNILALRRESVIPTPLVEGFEALLNEKKYQEAYELAKTDESMLGRVLAAGLGKLSTGYPQAIEAMQEVSEDETMKLEHRLSYVALIGTLAPMVGLLGTVHGMVNSFDVIANTQTQPRPQELAKGIQMALVTTLIGLLLAIPAIGLFAFLRNRMSRFVLETGILSEGLMGRFGKK